MTNNRHLIIKNTAFKGGSVVYVMSRDQRTADNHALLAAQALALQHKVPLYVLFVLRRVPGRSREHYEFMMEGLRKVSASLKKQNISFVIRQGNAVQKVTQFADEVDCGALFFDFSPLKHARAIIKQVAKVFSGSVVVVDTHNIIPVWIASQKQEFAAHTMRRKVHKHLQTFLVAPDQLVRHPFDAQDSQSMSEDEINAFVVTIPQPGITLTIQAGESAATKRLSSFIDQDLESYAMLRNDPTHDHQSGMSPYLHFGHISSLRVALEVIAAANDTPLLFEQIKLPQCSAEPSKTDGMNVLLEEMIVRKELSDNFCFYTADYTTIVGAPVWAQQSLLSHTNDPREFLYSSEELEGAATHDDAWNAAQKQMMKTGKMHGYMRMYWAKKILEWSKNPTEAIKTAMYLNDKYSIDGGDPNGYVGILWSIAGLHDRPWFERSVYGKIRYMNEGGLRKKFDLNAYKKQWL